MYYRHKDAPENPKVRERYGFKKTKKLAIKALSDQISAAPLKDLDSAFSWFVRLRDTDEFGYGKCCTCPTHVSVTEADCGHFISRGSMTLRYHEWNSHIQCRSCNRMRNSTEMIKAYEEYLNNLKPSSADALREMNSKLMKYSKDEKVALIIYYRKEAEKLNAQKRMPYVLPWTKAKKPSQTSV
jgi:hypothetical protein